MALATNSTPGSIVLAGDLTGSATAPQLRSTGVIPGSYVAPRIIVDSKGRIVWASNPDYATIEPFMPVATTGSKGMVQVSASDPGLQMQGATLVYNLRDATTSAPGAVTVSSASTSYLEIVGDGVLQMKTATTSSLGVITVGNGLAVNGDALQYDDTLVERGELGAVKVPSSHSAFLTLTNGVLAVNKIAGSNPVDPGMASFGSGLSVDGNGHVTLNAPDATTTTKGVVQIGDYINVTNGVISLTTQATSSSKGIFSYDPTGISRNSAGQLTINTAVGCKGIAQITSDANNGMLINNATTEIYLGPNIVYTGQTLQSYANRVSITPYDTGAYSSYPVNPNASQIIVRVDMALDGTLIFNNMTEPLEPGTMYHFVIMNTYGFNITATYGSQYKFKAGAIIQPSHRYTVLS